MTPKEAVKFCKDLQRQIGKDSYVSVYLNCHRYDDNDVAAFNGSIHTNWPHGARVVDCNADDLAALVERMRDSWCAYDASFRTERVKAMALIIIKITDEAGACNEEALRLAGYGADEIAALGEEAVTKANGMAGRGPFSIERSANNNATEAA